MITRLDRLQGRDIYENTALAKINELVDAVNGILAAQEQYATIYNEDIVPDAVLTKSKTIRTSGWCSKWGNKHCFDMPNPYGHFTITELELLQTLPINYTDGISLTQRRKAIGNGWTVDVIAHILKQLPTE